MLEKYEANSMPMTPPPIMAILLPSTGADNTSSEVSAFSMPFMGSTKGDEPVAISTLSVSRMVSPTTTVWLSAKLP